MSENKKNTIISFKDVNKTYDGKSLIVKDLNLDIIEGEFLTLLGPSGSGKTTCLMMLAGFEYPSSGQIWLRDKLLSNMAAHKRNIGMVFQNYALFPHMSVAQNIGYSLKVRKLAKNIIKEKVSKALNMIRMDEYANRYPAQLSGGQQQRVALARALVFEPKLILMDEPLGALDKQLREHMQIELKSIHQDLGLTFIYVTHDQSEALTMSDRIAIFNDGKIQQIDKANNLYEFPKNIFVANFIGDNNQFTGEITKVEDKLSEIKLYGSTEKIKGINISNKNVGEKTIACIRPERIKINKSSENKEDLNLIKATIKDIIYLGDHVRVICAVNQQYDISVKVSLDKYNIKNHYVGEEITTSFIFSNLRIF